jgi:hypothetical protein
MRASSRAHDTKFGRSRKVDDFEHIAAAKRMKADGHSRRGQTGQPRRRQSVADVSRQ